MARAQLEILVQDQDGDVQVGKSVRLTQVGTATAITETLYDAASGGGVVANPFQTASNGKATVYADITHRVDVYVDGTLYVANASFNYDPANIVLLDAVQTITGAKTFNAGITVVGTVSATTLVASQNASVAGSLAAGALAVTQDITAASLTTTGTVSAQTLAASGNASVGASLAAGALTVTGTAAAQTLTASGNASVAGGLSAALLTLPPGSAGNTSIKSTLDTDTGVYWPEAVIGRTATLVGAINAAVTLITLSSTGFVPGNLALPAYLKIDSEYMQITAKSGAADLTVVRGQLGSTAASHSNAAAVTMIDIEQWAVSVGGQNMLRLLKDSNGTWSMVFGPYTSLDSANVFDTVYNKGWPWFMVQGTESGSTYATSMQAGSIDLLGANDGAELSFKLTGGVDRQAAFSAHASNAAGAFKYFGYDVAVGWMQVAGISAGMRVAPTNASHPGFITLQTGRAGEAGEGIVAAGLTVMEGGNVKVGRTLLSVQGIHSANDSGAQLEAMSSGNASILVRKISGVAGGTTKLLGAIGADGDAYGNGNGVFELGGSVVSTGPLVSSLAVGVNAGDSMTTVGTFLKDGLQLANLAGTSVGNMLVAKNLVQAWVSFDTAGTINGSSHNVSSVSKASTGRYTVNFTRAFSSANYVCVATARLDATPIMARHGANAVGSIPIYIDDHAGAAADPTTVSVICVGLQ